MIPQTKNFRSIARLQISNLETVSYPHLQSQTLEGLKDLFTKTYLQNKPYRNSSNFHWDSFSKFRWFDLQCTYISVWKVCRALHDFWMFLRCQIIRFLQLIWNFELKSHKARQILLNSKLWINIWPQFPIRN